MCFIIVGPCRLQYLHHSGTELDKAHIPGPQLPNQTLQRQGWNSVFLSSTAGESHGTQSENQWLNWVTWDPTQILPPTWMLKSLSRFSVTREQSPSTDWLFPVCLALCV